MIDNFAHQLTSEMGHIWSFDCSKFQKNPSAIRHPEEESEWELFQMDVRVDVRSFAQLSPHIPVVCSEAHDNTYSRRSDLELILQSQLDFISDIVVVVVAVVVVVVVVVVVENLHWFNVGHCCCYWCSEWTLNDWLISRDWFYQVTYMLRNYAYLIDKHLITTATVK